MWGSRPSTGHTHEAAGVTPCHPCCPTVHQSCSCRLCQCCCKYPYPTVHQPCSCRLCQPCVLVCFVGSRPTRTFGYLVVLYGVTPNTLVSPFATSGRSAFCSIVLVCFVGLRPTRTFEYLVVLYGVTPNTLVSPFARILPTFSFPSLPTFPSHLHLPISTHIRLSISITPPPFHFHHIPS